VFCTNATTTARGPLGRILKAAAPAMAFAATLAVAGASQATAYFLQSGSIDYSYYAHLSDASPIDGNGPYATENAVLGPILFKVNYGTVASADSFDLLAFCVDIFHNINVGTLNLKYDDLQPFNSNSDSPASLPISVPTQQLVGRLANYGQAVYESTDVNKVEKLAAVQGAIWKAINPGLNVVAYQGAWGGLNSGAVNGLIDNYVLGQNMNDHGPLSSKLVFISETGLYTTDRAHQSFVFGVPEPATWALMIGGFGMTGSMLRRRQRRMARART
jgi:hypothetical protein